MSHEDAFKDLWQRSQQAPARVDAWHWTTLEDLEAITAIEYPAHPVIMSPSEFLKLMKLYQPEDT